MTSKSRHESTPVDEGASRYASVENEKEAESIDRNVAIETTLEGLDELDASVIRSQVISPTTKLSLFKLYRFATPFDVFLVLLGIVMAVAHGVALPMTMLIFGRLSNDFNGFVIGETGSAKEFLHQLNHNALYLVYIGIVIICTGTLQTLLLTSRGEVLSSRYRKEYMKSILRQNIAYFDNLGSGEVTTQLVNDTFALQDSIGEKSGFIIAGGTTFIASVVISFTQSWKLTLIGLTGVAFLVIASFIIILFVTDYSLKADNIYAAGSSVAEEAFSMIRTTVAFSSQKKLVDSFDGFLRRYRHWSSKVGLSMATLMAVQWSFIFWIFALVFWEGSRLITRNEINVGQLMAVSGSLIIGAYELGDVAPMFQYTAKGMGAASNLNRTIDRDPVVDVFAHNGSKLPSVEGDIVFKNIRFRYPARPDVLVFSDFSLKVEKGTTVALVGLSGSGKSTIVSLLEKFYIPISGLIELDGVDISTLDTQWFRQQIGYVSQEPTLFSVSIFENIAYGLGDQEFSEAERRNRVIEACKNANAWDFIQKFPAGLDTMVGEGGILLSGGQKQRIAIARAIVSDPKILLLDEATSALDTVSESIVQDALDRASKNRTTIIIAHRLSTIKDADKIVVMSKGEIVEQGNHATLLEAKGTYANLVELQKVSRALEVEKVPTSSELDVKKESMVITPSGDIKPISDDFFEEDRHDNSVQTQEPSLKQIASLIWTFNKTHWKLTLFGLLCAAVQGYGYPALSLVMGKMTESLMVDPSQYDQMRRNVNLYSGMFFMEGGILLFFVFFSTIIFTYLSDAMVRTVRLRLFRQFLRMDASFYDAEENTSGSLTAILGTEGKAIEGMGGATLGHIIQTLVMLIAGIITAIAVSWKIGLVGMACVPIVVFCGFLRYRILTNLEERANEVYKTSGTMAASYTSAIRTVQSLAREYNVIDMYSNTIDEQVRKSNTYLMPASVAYGFSKGLTPWVLALMFWFAGKQLAEGKISIFDFFVVVEATIFGAETAGTLFTFAPNMGKAQRAAKSVYGILNRDPVIDISSNQGDRLQEDELQGNIEFSNVVFRYPSRPDISVLNGLTLQAQKGQYIALVGPSGSGKSTTIGLIERFYDTLSGEVKFDGKNIKSLNLHDLRSHMALVQQEPALYSGTVRENILMGWNGKHESDVTDEMIEDVAKKANIHEFITSLPNGYNTVVGPRGTLLSGGQKQRIAIARALIRNPKVLLLDEATSALDSESEKIVQEAIDKAAQGRTTISIAHRLSTIQKADVIYVLDKGVIVESGKHDELIEKGGLYAELAKLQFLSK